MKILLKSLIGLLIVLVSAVILAWYNPHLIESAIKSFAERSFSNKTLQVKIHDVKLTTEILLFKNISLGNIATIEKIEVIYNLKKLLSKRKLICQSKIYNFTMDLMRLNAAGDITYSSSIKKVDNLKVDFVDGGSMILDAAYRSSYGQPLSLSMNGNVSDLPLMLHKAFWAMAPENEVIIFLKDYISNGYVSGNWNINLDSEFFKSGSVKPESFTGKFALRDVALRYDIEYPALQHLNANVDMAGSKTIFNVTHRYSGGVALYDGRVDLDLAKGSHGELVIKTKGHGPVADLIEFIPPTTLDELKKSGIDLKKVSGQMKIDFNMAFPLAPGEIEPVFDVKVDINRMGLKLFDDKVDLAEAMLYGTFDGKNIRLSGKGKVNGFDSSLDYNLKLGLGKVEAENILGIKLQFIPLKSKANSNISTFSGKSIVDILYKSKGNKGQLNANANLQNLDFFVEKLGLRKKAGSKANLQVVSFGNGLSPSGVNIKIIGEDNLEILGNMQLVGKNKVINISKLQYLNTDMKAQLTVSTNAIKAIISGSKLDLSNANMMSFLEKGESLGDADLQVNISKIKMKNNIYLNNFAMKVKCDKSTCYHAEMDSMIGSQSFKIHLGKNDGVEQWEISTTNAGAMLKALGMYDKIKAGNLMLVVNAARKDVKPGDPIPIVNGYFTLKKFVVADAPVLTRMVSFISFSGIKNALTNNRDIGFSEMMGDFKYSDGVIKIRDCGAEGPFFDFTMKGSINTNEHIIKLKGNVTPFLYGMSKVGRHFPIIGNILFGGGRRKGLISSPYAVKSKY